jgi:hypothetical protein
MLIGCSNEDQGVPDFNEDDDIIQLDVGNSPVRKIIYRAEMNIYTDNLDQTIENIYLLIEDDEWLDYESITDSRATFVIRINTSRLDQVILSIKTQEDVSTSQKNATDISLKYQDTSDKIAALILQRDRLIELYEDASLTDMIIINEQLSSIEILIAQYQGELNEFDSLADYSELKLYIYESKAASRAPFFPRVWMAFENGYKTVFVILDALVIGIITLIPISIVFVPIGFAIYKIRKKVMMKKKNHQKDSKDNLSNN